MKGKPGLRLLLALFALTFACVLLSGAGRLLGAQAQQPRESLPAVVSLLVSEWMRKKNWIRFGDMKISTD